MRIPRAGSLNHIFQQERFLHPEKEIATDYRTIYKKNQIVVGWPKGKKRIFHEFSRSHSVCVVGVALGDEGKGRVIDNKIEDLLHTRAVTGITVIRFQGGNNSGHTVQIGDMKLALHQIPCGIVHKKATCIMDRGMTINPIDLVDEIHRVEKLVGNIDGRLFLSGDAVLNTDLDRAEEIVNRIRQGKTAGGTGKGIGPSYAHHYDRLGFHISDLMDKNWEERLGAQYDRYAKEFELYGLKISDIIPIPDFKGTKHSINTSGQSIGTKKDFLDRLSRARKELLVRKIITNTFVLHKRIYEKKSEAVLFEGAQALGLHPWLGTLPDITASDTSTYGIQTGTAFWKMQNIEDRIGIFKIPYTSSVGARCMPTQADEEWAHRVREEAHEYGTTTGRPRDILFPDMPMLSYNIRMSGVEMLVGTHLDTAWDNVSIEVCTHYTDKRGRAVSYQPGLLHLADVIPHYITLPGWDGTLVRKAKSFNELPENAKKFLAFLQLRLATPIVAVTTGPSRENYLKIS